MTTASPAARAWRAEQHRLTGIAYRMLGDYALAEDVVADVAVAALRAEEEAGRQHEPVRSWPAWLTTVCVRRSIDRLRQLASAREDYPGPWLPEPVDTHRLPEEVVADRELLSIGLLHLAEQLSPEARAAVVLHRAFGMTAVEIASVLQRSPASVRQLVSRAERRLEISPDAPPRRAADPGTLTALVTALETGEIATLLELLTDDAVLFSDGGGRVRSALNPISGAQRIVRFVAGVLAKAAADPSGLPVQVGLRQVNGEPAVQVRRGDRRDLVLLEADQTGRIRVVRQIANPDKLTRVGG